MTEAIVAHSRHLVSLKTKAVTMSHHNLDVREAHLISVLHMLNVEWRLVYILKQFSEHMHIYYMCIIYNKYTYQYIEEDSFLGIC